MDEERVIGHAVGDIAESEDMAVVPWKDWARLKLIEEKAANVHELARMADDRDASYSVDGDTMAELGAALEGYRSDI